MRAAHTSAVLLVAACQGRTGSGWQVVDDAVDGHMLSAWCDGEATRLVGGREGLGFVAATDGSTWEVLDGGGGRALRWVWGGGAAGQVVVGDGGTVLRLESGGLVPQFSSLGGDVTLWGVWGSSSEDVWAVGGSLQGGARGVIMHWDGTAWIPFAADEAYDVNFFKVWGCAQDRAWIVGELGTILGFDGTAWAREAVPSDADLYTVHGTQDCAQVLAVGLARTAGHGVVLRRSEAGWDVLFDDVRSPLFGTCGDAEERWVVGAAGYAARVVKDGLDEAPAPTDLDLHACFRAPGCGLWAVGGNLLGASSPLIGVVAHRGSRVPGGPIAGAGGDAGTGDGPPTGTGDIGPGQECPSGSTASCQPGLRCWYLMEARRFVCTKDCDDAAFCDAESFPPSCCRRPGTQTTATVCVPESFSICP